MIEIAHMMTKYRAYFCYVWSVISDWWSRKHSGGVSKQIFQLTYQVLPETATSNICRLTGTIVFLFVQQYH